MGFGLWPMLYLPVLIGKFAWQPTNQSLAPNLFDRLAVGKKSLLIGMSWSLWRIIHLIKLIFGWTYQSLWNKKHQQLSYQIDLQCRSSNHALKLMERIFPRICWNVSLMVPRRWVCRLHLMCHIIILWYNPISLTLHHVDLLYHHNIYYLEKKWSHLWRRYILPHLRWCTCVLHASRLCHVMRWLYPVSIFVFISITHDDVSQTLLT